MSFPDYDQYKDSGRTWLGEVPAHWNLKPLWTFYRRSKRTGFLGQELLSVYRDYGVIPKSSRDDNFNKPSEDLSPYQLVEPSDLVINKMKAWQGSVAVSGYRGIVSPAYHVFACMHDQDSRYLHYLMRSPRYITGYRLMSKGIRVNQWDLEPQQHTRMPLLVPPANEQKAISSFLDAETSKIDALVSEQRRLIELLKEKRQAVISHAVTKGLNPNAPMKPSGIEWIGDVPRHWVLKPLKFIGQIISGFAFKSHAFTDEGVRVVKIANIQTFNLDWSDESFVPESFYEDHENYGVLNGDIVFALTRPIISTGLKAAIADVGDELVLLNQRNAIFRPTDKLDKHFFYHVLFSESFRIDFENKIDFTGQQPNISPLDIADIKIPFPPKTEQEEISGYLDGEVEYFAQLQAEAERAIELLQERRTALISAAVTGKIDVRGWEDRKTA